MIMLTNWCYRHFAFCNIRLIYKDITYQDIDEWKHYFIDWKPESNVTDYSEGYRVSVGEMKRSRF